MSDWSGAGSADRAAGIVEYAAAATPAARALLTALDPTRSRRDQLRRRGRSGSIETGRSSWSATASWSGDSWLAGPRLNENWRPGAARARPGALSRRPGGCGAGDRCHASKAALRAETGAAAVTWKAMSPRPTRPKPACRLRRCASLPILPSRADCRRAAPDLRIKPNGGIDLRQVPRGRQLATPRPCARLVRRARGCRISIARCVFVRGAGLFRGSRLRRGPRSPRRAISTSFSARSAEKTYSAGRCLVERDVRRHRAFGGHAAQRDPQRLPGLATESATAVGS